MHVTFSDVERSSLELSDLGMPLCPIHLKTGVLQPVEPENGVIYVPEDFIERFEETEPMMNPYSTGYGMKIPSSQLAICADGRKRRVYVMQFSNAGSAYIIVCGKRLHLR